MAIELIHLVEGIGVISAIGETSVGAIVSIHWVAEIDGNITPHTAVVHLIEIERLRIDLVARLVETLWRIDNEVRVVSLVDKVAV